MSATRGAGGDGRSAPIAAHAIDALVGRTDELDELAELVRRARLVTVLGPPGVGKTRLVRTVFARMLARSDQLRWVDLERARTEDEVLHALAGALDVPSRIAALASAAAGKTLVLDNVEQVAGPAARCVHALLSRALDARCVVTSRERLGVAGEVTMVLEPLPETDAVALFHERARERRSDYRADDACARAIVTRLDCIPLAIELAASQSVILGLPDLLLAIERDPDVLRSDVRDAPERQATLAGAIEWSWRLLDAADQRALARAAVFCAPFPLEAAVTLFEEDEATTLRRLKSLVERSLLRVIAPPSREHERWFGSYSVVRRFALDKLRDLGEESNARASATGELLSQPWQYLDDASFLRLAVRAPDLRAIAERATADRDGALAAQGLARLAEIATRRGPVGPLLPLADRVVELATGTDRIVALRGRARLRLRGGDHAEAASDLRAALEIAGDADDELHLDLAAAYRHSRRATDAEALYRRAVASAKEPALRRAQLGLAGLLHEVGRLDDAEALYDTVLAELERRGDRLHAGIALQNLGTIHQERGELDRAQAHFRRALAMHREVGHVRFEGIALFDLAAADFERGASRAARDGFSQALELLTGVGDGREAALSLALRASSSAACGVLARAEPELDEAEEALASRPDTDLRAAVLLHRGHVDLARGLVLLRDADVDGWRRAVERARARLAGEPTVENDETRYATRVLGRAVAVHDAIDGALLVAPDASWLRPPGGEPVDLSHRETLRRILAGLLERRLTNPASGLDQQALLVAGWGDERIHATAAKNRVQVALSQLRKLGLSETLVRDHASGYELDPRVPVLVCALRDRGGL
jgi:predicted ATPase